MAAVLHGSARTTPRIRAELQRSKVSTRTLAARYQLNPKTVAKWRARQTTGDAAMGPRDPRSTGLSLAEEAMIVEFRRRTLLPLLSEAEHLHHSTDDQAEQFRQLALRVGVGDFDKVFSDESF